MPGVTIVLPLLLLAPPHGVSPSIGDHPLARHFSVLDGCFVLQNLATDQCIAVNADRCGERLSPCSTFKIPHAIIALELGVLEDENAQLNWNGDSQPIKSWERDHTLVSAMENSVLWYFQHCARRIGAERMGPMVEKIGYGNARVDGPIDRFWLGDGSLRISADEQVEFLARLYRDELPVGERAVGIVRRLIVQEGMDDFDGRFSGKTGSHWVDGRWVLGWFVGSVEHDGTRYVFATNIRGEDGASGMRARDITVAILRDLGLLAAADSTRQVSAGPSR